MSLFCCACTCSVSQCAVCVFGIAPVVGLSFSRLLALRRYSIGCSQVAGGASYCMCMLVKRLRVDGGVRSRVVSDTRDFNAVIYTLQLDQHQIVSATQRYTPRCENHTAAPSRVDGRLDRGPVASPAPRRRRSRIRTIYSRASHLSLSLSLVPELTRAAGKPYLRASRVRRDDQHSPLLCCCLDIAGRHARDAPEAHAEIRPRGQLSHSPTRGNTHTTANTHTHALHYRQYALCG